MFVIMLMPKAGDLHNAESTDLSQQRVFRYRVTGNAINDSEVRDYTERTVNYSNDRPSADEIARLMASRHAGRDVHILETTGVFSSSIPEVIQKQVTNEGVLPF